MTLNTNIIEGSEDGGVGVEGWTKFIEDEEKKAVPSLGVGEEVMRESDKV